MGTRRDRWDKQKRQRRLERADYRSEMRDWGRSPEPPRTRRKDPYEPKPSEIRRKTVQLRDAAEAQARAATYFFDGLQLKLAWDHAQFCRENGLVALGSSIAAFEGLRDRAQRTLYSCLDALRTGSFSLKWYSELDENEVPTSIHWSLQFKYRAWCNME